MAIIRRQNMVEPTANPGQVASLQRWIQLPYVTLLIPNSRDLLLGTSPRMAEKSSYDGLAERMSKGALHDQL